MRSRFRSTARRFVWCMANHYKHALDSWEAGRYFSYMTTTNSESKSSPSSKIALFGAAGAIGQSIASALRAEGKPYRVVGRSHESLARQYGLMPE